MVELPEYERPPASEVVVAVQFVPLPQFGMREALTLARAFEDWEIVDVVDALEPIVEPPPGQVTGPALRFGLGSPPRRLLLSADGGRWVAQFQQDRLVLHERRIEQRPTFSAAAGKLREVTDRAAGAIGRPLFEPPNQAELVEVIYDNALRQGEGWSQLSELHQVLRIVAGRAGEEPFADVEQAQVGFTYVLLDEDRFAGRLRVLASPHIIPRELPSIRLQLISRRIVGGQDLEVVLKQSHADIVEAFTAVTTEHMHEVWRRTR